VLHPALRTRGVRQAASVVVIVVLVASAFLTGRNTDSLRADVNTSTSAAKTNAASVDKVETILADVCKAAPDKSVAQSGRADECKLAEAGKIDQKVPVVQPQVRYQPVSRSQIEQVVDAYLANRLQELPEQYRSALRQEVVAYLRQNPPKDGKDGAVGPPPSPAQIAPVVASYVAAHPPPAAKDGVDGKAGEAGKNGVDGVSVMGAALDGCDLVFSFSNDTTVRVGPICGKDGTDGKAGSDGPKGEQGRGVASQNCVTGDDIDQDGDGVVAATDWLITYDKPDAEGVTSQRIDGPCRVG
jgi:hypothetical protein